MIVFIGFILFYSPAFAATEDAQAEYFFQQGLAALQFGEFKKAVTLFDQVLTRDPNYVDAFINKGIALFELGKYDEAIVQYDKALEIDPNSAMAYNNKGFVFATMEKFDEAISYYNKAIEIDPTYLTALYNRADAFWKQWYCEDAINYYDQIIEIDPEPAEAHLYKAWALSSLGLVEDALLNLDIALASDPNILEPYDRTFVIMIDQNRFSEEFWQNLLQKHPNVWNGVNSKTVYFTVLALDKAELDAVCIKTVTSGQPEIIPEIKPKIPDWIRNNAKWWADGLIGDSDFTSGIQFMIKENIMVIPDLPEVDSGMELKDEKRAMGMEREQNVPDWVRNNAGWWADGLISADDFISGIKYLVEQGIIKV